MTDEQIVKVLALCSARGCDECPRIDNGIPYEDTCRMELIRIAGDIIERQKSEIENYSITEKDLRYRNKEFQNANKKQSEYIKELESELNANREIRAEAIKEFAERIKATITVNNTNDGYLDYAVDYNCLMEDIDNLVKEMTEGE